MEHLPEILKVAGLDGCFIGAGDMALFLGRKYYGGRGDPSEVQRLVDRAQALTLEAGKLVMLPAADGAQARRLAERGAHLATLNIGALVRRACEDYLGAFRGRAGAG